MRKNAYFVNIVLMMEVGIFCLCQRLLQIGMPEMILMKMNVSFLVLLSVIPMIVSFYLGAKPGGNVWVSMLLAGVTFAIFPLCAGVGTGFGNGTRFIAGTIIFGITAFIYASMEKRMMSGISTKFAPVVHGFLVFLASQCLQGIL